MVPYSVYDVKIQRTKDYGCIRLECIAPEDYGMDSNAKTCDKARFQYHRARKTRSDLIEMGYDRDEVEKIGQTAEWDNPTEAARNQFQHEHSGDVSTEIIDLYECYIRCDINGDGIAENGEGRLRRSQIRRRHLLDWQEWEDENPFDDVPCDPLPHRWEARS